MRPLFEKMGAVVLYDSVAQTVMAYRGESQIRMKVGDAIAFVNERQVKLEEAPLIERGTIMVPLRFVAEAMGAEIGWDGQDTIVISTTPITEGAVGSNASRASSDLPPLQDPLKLPRPPSNLKPESDKATAENPNELPAEKLLVIGQLRLAHSATRVLGTTYPKMFVLSEEDGNLTFQLSQNWQWFEAQLAVPDTSPSSVAEIDGWFDGSPHKTAFKSLRLRSNQPPTTIRIKVTDATKFTLAPVYPGYPVLIINPRFMR
jgi:hypothetical protein